MNVKQVAEFINSGHVMLTMKQPETGYAGPVLPVFFAEVDGQKLAIAYKLSDLNYTTTVAHVREIVALGDVVTVSLKSDDPQIHSALVLEKIVAGDKAKQWETTFDFVEGNDDAIKAELKLRAQDAAPIADEDRSQLKDYSFSRVAVLRGNGLYPKGVLLQQDSGIEPRTFDPESTDLDRFASMPTLDEAAERSGRSLVVGGAEKVKATSQHQAFSRAMYRFARDWYGETGRTLYT
jgi:hypothetical protein